MEKSVDSCTIKITESPIKRYGNSDPQEPEFSAEKDPINRTEQSKTAYRFGTRTTPRSIRCDVRLIQRDVATRRAIQSVQSILLLIQPERELFVVFFETQKSTRVQELKR